MMKLKSFVKDSIFLQSYNVVRPNLSVSMTIFLFDLMFLVSFLTLQKLAGYSAQAVLPYANASPFLILFALSIIYYLILLFVYSIFKFSVLVFIKSFFAKSKYSFREFWKFYALK